MCASPTGLARPSSRVEGQLAGRGGSDAGVADRSTAGVLGGAMGRAASARDAKIVAAASTKRAANLITGMSFAWCFFRRERAAGFGVAGFGGVSWDCHGEITKIGLGLGRRGPGETRRASA